MSEDKSIAQTQGRRRLSKQGQAAIKRRANKFEVIKRRKEVRKLRISGVPVHEIAERLGVSSQTVSKDLAAVRKDMVKDAKSFDLDVFVSESMERRAMIDQLALQTFQEAKEGSATRIKALDVIRLNDMDRTKTLVDTGVIAKEAHHVEVTHHHQLSWDEDMKQRVADALLDTSLTTPLLPPVPEEQDYIDVTPVGDETVGNEDEDDEDEDS